MTTAWQPLQWKILWFKKKTTKTYWGWIVKVNMPADTVTMQLVQTFNHLFLSQHKMQTYEFNVWNKFCEGNTSKRAFFI